MQNAPKSHTGLWDLSLSANQELHSKKVESNAKISFSSRRMQTRAFEDQSPSEISWSFSVDDFLFVTVVIATIILAAFASLKKIKTVPEPDKVQDPIEKRANMAAIIIQRYLRIFSARKTALKALAVKDEFKMLDRVTQSKEGTKELFKKFIVKERHARVNPLREFVQNKLLKNGSTYTGEVNKKSMPEGQGVVVYADKGFYQGQLKNGKSDQRGLRVTKNVAYYGLW